jgi:hypothetical protein
VRNPHGIVKVPETILSFVQALAAPIELQSLPDVSLRIQTETVAAEELPK